ncbi:MAG: hypothetical protein U9Q99_00325 [Nanoarchaeota archaeon]|nr:hypothetical protein [Nanoarchaeota archaeon]
MKEIKKVPPKFKFKFKERHVIYNWQESPEMADNEKMIRYHFIICDDRFREAKIEKILSNFRKKTIMNYPFEEIRKEEGKAESTNFRYLFLTYDSKYDPRLLNFENVSKNVKQDINLRERKKGHIEDYVANMYSERN